MATKRMLLMLVAVAVVFGGVFYKKNEYRVGMAMMFDNMPVSAATIATTQAQAMQWPNELLSVGSVVPVNGTDVTTQVDGIVSAIHFSSGAEVAKGALLLSLESAAERAELDRLQAQAEIALINRTRAADLRRRKALSQAEFDTASATAVAANAAVAEQQAKVAQKEIRAPFAGVLGIRRANLGQYLSPGTPIVTLQALDPIEVEFGLPERQLGQVAAGLDVEVMVDAYPGLRFPGEITVIEPRVEVGTRNFRMRARLPNPEGKLRVGMFARVDILRPGETQVVAIPRTAIKYDSYGSSVFLVAASEDDPEQLIAQHRFVRTGVARGDFIAVTEGLAEGDTVVFAGLLKLRNGQPVVVDNTLTPAVSQEPSPADS